MPVRESSRSSPTSGHHMPHGRHVLRTAKSSKGLLAALLLVLTTCAIMPACGGGEAIDNIVRRRLDSYLEEVRSGTLELNSLLHIVRDSGHEAIQYAYPRILPLLKDQLTEDRSMGFLVSLLDECAEPLGREAMDRIKKFKSDSKNATLRDLADQISAKQEALEKDKGVANKRSDDERRQETARAIGQIQVDGIYNVTALNKLVELGADSLTGSLPVIQPLLRLDMSGRHDVVFHELRYLKAFDQALPEAVIEKVTACTNGKSTDPWVLEMAKSVLVRQSKVREAASKSP